MSKRPTGYNETNPLQQKHYQKYKNIILRVGRKEVLINPILPALLIFIIFCSIGFVPLIMHFLDIDFPFIGGSFLGYRQANGLACVQGNACYGPFGAGAVLLSLFIPLGMLLSLAVYYRLRTRILIKLRNQTKKLEKEFSGSLFQLGSRIGDGIPVELGFEEIAQNMKGTSTGDFFSRICSNMRTFGLGMKQAIFGIKGAIQRYPSSLIQTSMKVLIESSKKGPAVVSKSLMDMSSYIKDIHRVNERLKDILSDIISSMKSQISFLTPIIAGIVVGISSMIVTILVKLTQSMTIEATENQVFGGISLNTLATMFRLRNIIPSYYLQLIVGIYVIEIIFLLTKLSNSIQYGRDNLNEKYTFSKNLYLGGMLYFFTALFITIIFTFLSITIVP